MKMYVGVTDNQWFEFLKSKRADEVNFWKPGTTQFKALKENDLFLFKLHSPYNYIVGGGFFVKYTSLPTFLAWNAFGEKNGHETRESFESSINRLKVRINANNSNTEIGCIILTDVFYFDEEDWIPAPDSFNRNIVQGKTYDTEEADGKQIYEAVIERIKSNAQPSPIAKIVERAERYTEYMTKHRLGQGAFRVMVTDAYNRRCAITGEKTLPVLEAAHIKPYSYDGPHSVDNGILLKSDFHTLFDGGYITIDKDLRVEVSNRLHEDFGNGKDYYKYHGSKLMILPDNTIQMPSKEYLEWHNENVYLG